MKIESFSIAPGASVTVPLIAITGQTGQIRAPLPTPDAAMQGGEYFTIEVVGVALKITGIAEGSGTITLITENQRITYPVTVEKTNVAERWQFAFSTLDISYTAPPEPPEPVTLEVTNTDQRLQLRWTGDGDDRPADVDWGDGNVETIPAGGQPAQHDYDANGTYDFSVTPQADGDITYPPSTGSVTVDHYPTVTMDDDNDPLVTISHDKGDISTTVDWGDGIVDTALSSTFDHVYSANGAYKIKTTIGGFAAIETDVIIANADPVSGSVPPENAVCYGPFEVAGTQFWICTGDGFMPSLGFDVDHDPEVDIQIPFNGISGVLNHKRKIKSGVRLAVLAKLREYL